MLLLSKRALPFLIAGTVFAFCGLGSVARSDEPPGVARISVLSGDVAIKHGDSGDQLAAVRNAPVETGDYLSTGDDGRTEVQLDPNNALRSDGNTEIRFTQLDGASDVAQLAQGSVVLRVFDLSQDKVTVQTPSVDIVPNEAGSFLINVDRNGDTQVTARLGSLSVNTPQGSQTVEAGTTMEITGSASDPQYQVVDEVAVTDFDRWSDDRDREYLQVASLAPYEYVNDSVVGANDLSQDGTWEESPGNGEVWQPNDVAADWSPYSDGTWAYEPYYGPTWVGNEPWAWAPYHYGRWVHDSDDGWAWAPGSRGGRPAWSPALVVFIGFGSGGSNAGGSGGNVGWIPLAPGDPLRRWWGPERRSAPTDGATIARYRNYNHGVIALPVTGWQQGNFTHIRRLLPGEARGAQVIAGRIPIAATPRNFAFTARPIRTTVPQPRTGQFGSFQPVRHVSPIRANTGWQNFGSPRARGTAIVQRQAPATARSWQRFSSTSAPRIFQRPQPVYQRERPVYQRAQPVYQREQPVRQREQPVVQRAQPVYQRAQPVSQREQPVSRREQPVVQRSQPSSGNASRRTGDRPRSRPPVEK